MCELCSKIKANENYGSLLSEMEKSDIARLESTKKFQSLFPSAFAYSTIDYPSSIIQPMFEPKMPFAKPLNYFQNLFVNGERSPNNFAHGATRSIFFIGKRLMLLSKNVAFHEGEEFFSSFLLAHFEPGEFAFEISPQNQISISASLEKSARNMLAGKVQKIKVEFSFFQENLENQSFSVKKMIYAPSKGSFSSRPGMAGPSRLSSKDLMLDYELGVMHFSPHPYMFMIHEELGYASQTELQKDVINYFGAHLGDS